LADLTPGTKVSLILAWLKNQLLLQPPQPFFFALLLFLNAYFTLAF